MHNAHLFFNMSLFSGKVPEKRFGSLLLGVPGPHGTLWDPCGPTWDPHGSHVGSMLVQHGSMLVQYGPMLVQHGREPTRIRGGKKRSMLAMLRIGIFL